MMRSRDPRIRQTINQISSNLEIANESAQEGIYTFSQNYISPCFASIGNCLSACAEPCLPSRVDQLRRRRRGCAEDNFDFYDDWDNDVANDNLLGWGTDELDRLLAGSGLARGRGTPDQPRRQRTMSYGTRGPRRTNTIHAPSGQHDPTVIPSSSFLGFLERFPWRLGARGVKYRPSAADLQEHPGTSQRLDIHENTPLLGSDGGGGVDGPTSGYEDNGRDRSATQSSSATSNSLSSRGDLIPSDEEEDAVPLDDEFALALGHRGSNTGLDFDDQTGGKSISTRRSTSGTLGSTDASFKEIRIKKKRNGRKKSSRATDIETNSGHETQSMNDLKKEEEQVELKEEQEIGERRLAAHRLASSRGLDQSNRPPSCNSPSISSPVVSDFHHESDIQSPRGSVHFGHDRQQTEPFPSLPQTPVSPTGRRQSLQDSLHNKDLTTLGSNTKKDDPSDD